MRIEKRQGALRDRKGGKSADVLPLLHRLTPLAKPLGESVSLLYKEFIELNIQGVCQGDQDTNRWVGITAFNARQVGPVNTASFGECLLGHSRFCSEGFHLPAECFLHM